VSQETCLDKISSTGGVSRWCALAPPGKLPARTPIASPWPLALIDKGLCRVEILAPRRYVGYPRIGPRRELKLALGAYWSGKSDEQALLEIAAALRATNWARQHARGVTIIPSNDFSFYDQVLDTSVMVGAIPALYGWTGGPVSLGTYLTDLLKLARKRLSDDQLWINPDCGLKTRKWEEVRPALVNMVKAAERSARPSTDGMCGCKRRAAPPLTPLLSKRQPPLPPPARLAGMPSILASSPCCRVLRWNSRIRWFTGSLTKALSPTMARVGVGVDAP